MIDSRLHCGFGIFFLRCIVLFLLLGSMISQLHAQQVSTQKVSVARVASEQVYVQPKLWPGVLLLQSGKMAEGEELPEVEKELLSAILARNAGRVLLVTDAATNAGLERAGIVSDQASKVVRLTSEKWRKQLDDAEAVKGWGDCAVIWIDADGAEADALRSLESATHERLVTWLKATLAQGGFVRASGDLSWLGSDREGSREGSREGLLANCSIEQSTEVNSEVNSTVAAAEKPPCVQLRLLDGVRCVLTNRQLVNLTKDQPVVVTLAATKHYATPLTESLKQRQSIDWVQWQRALLERERPHFPGTDRTEHVLAGGSLVIGGGGGMPEEVWKRFVELAGGANASIVILPTAVEDPSAEPSFEARVMRQAGAEHIVTMPQTARDEVEAAAFLSELDRATGVWFGGGRQWRFVDAYWGTAAWPRLLDVCKRGGVIGGSSAGATIQGDLLVRGAPAGNQIMIAEGYRRGLGLLPGVAIDQHFAQRNRFKELEGCLAAYPSICGVGIDEQTALVVTGANRCEVIGVGSAWLYPSYEVSASRTEEAATRAAMRKEFKSGSVFELNAN